MGRGTGILESRVLSAPVRWCDDGQLFAVYPVGGAARAVEGPALDVLDRCRIRWGRVEFVDGDVVAVRSRPLRFEGSRLVVGPPRVEEVRRSLNGLGFVPDLEPGGPAALHWDWVCDPLSGRQLRWLRHCTAQPRRGQLFRLQRACCRLRGLGLCRNTTHGMRKRRSGRNRRLTE